MGGKKMYAGLCVGGPMAGMDTESRFPEGFVLLQKPQNPDEEAGSAWVYDYDADTETFYAREADTFDATRAAKAAAEPRYDVRAFDPEVMA